MSDFRCQRAFQCTTLLSTLLQNAEKNPKFILLVFDLCVSYMFRICLCVLVICENGVKGQNIGYKLLW